MVINTLEAQQTQQQTQQGQQVEERSEGMKQLLLSRSL